MARTAFLGGTGPEGLGLALRFALAGEDIIIGSRNRERAEVSATELRGILQANDCGARVEGMENGDAAAAAEIVALAVPYEGLQPLVLRIGPACAGKMVLDVVNPLVFRDGLFHMPPVNAGSAGQLIQQLLPNSPVVSGFKNLSAKELLDPKHRIEGDVLLCGDHPAATTYFAKLIERIPALRPVDAGSMVNAQHLESITTLLLNLNRRHKALTSVRILGL